MNFMFAFIFFSIQGQLSYLLNTLSVKPFTMFFYLFQPIFIFPWDVVAAITVFSERAMLAMLVGLIISPLIASVVAGNYGERELESFEGWFLIALTCTIIWMIFLPYDTIFRFYIDTFIPLESAILTIILTGLLFCVLYGFVASLTTCIKRRLSENE